MESIYLASKAIIYEAFKTKMDQVQNLQKSIHCVFLKSRIYLQRPYFYNFFIYGSSFEW